MALPPGLSQATRSLVAARVPFGLHVRRLAIGPWACLDLSMRI